MSKKKFCLNMIVKNEAHIICEAFDNLLTYIPIDYWVISDTGSTDDTKNIIKTYFKEKGIEGELFEHEWQDFGYNRTKALESAYDKSEYLLIFDADDKIIGDFKLPPNLFQDMYQLQFGKAFTYLRPLLLNNRKKWKYTGVLHEYLEANGHTASCCILGGDYFIDSRRLGDRNKNPNKYRDDAIILKNAFELEYQKEDKSLSPRYAFYCAQSYKDANMLDEAIEWYKKCLDMNNWLQEKFYSALMIGSMLLKKGFTDESQKYFLKTIEYDVERIEGIVSAMEILQKRNEHLLVNSLYHRFKNYDNCPSNCKLFVTQYVYKDRIEYLNSISSSYVNDKESGYHCCKKILLSELLPVGELCQTIRNLSIYKEFLQNDQNEDLVKLFENVDKIIFSNKLEDSSTKDSWKILYEKRRAILKKRGIPNSGAGFIKIVNLLRRPDRKKDILEKLINLNVDENSYNFIKAVDGKELQPIYTIKQLFKNNDFKYRKGVLGCALSHFNLWEQLLADPLNDFYIILEDDITLCKNFKENIESMKETFLDKDVIFLGYHMLKETRKKFEFLYDCDSKDIKTSKLVKKLFFGGTFAYSINKLGAKKLLENANKNGIKRAIDYFMFDSEEVECWESRPHLVFSEYFSGREDTDIQTDFDCLTFSKSTSVEYIFLQGIDQIGNDIIRIKTQETQVLLDAATNTPGCIAVNTFGYLKHDINKLEKVNWFSEKDGIFIKKEVYEEFIKKQKESYENTGITILEK